MTGPWVFYHEDGFRGTRTAEEVHALPLLPAFLVQLPAPAGEIGRSDLPRKVVNVSRKHFSYRMDGEKLSNPSVGLRYCSRRVLDRTR